MTFLKFTHDEIDLIMDALQGKLHDEKLFGEVLE